jgi:cytochrome P450
MIGWAVFDGLFFFSMRRPRLLRFGMGLFRRWKPIFASPFAGFGDATFLVTRADDVREVLEHPKDFLLGPVNERKILSGDFVISLDPERRYRAEKGLIRESLKSLPMDRLKLLEDITDAAAQNQLQGTIANPFEVVEFAERCTVAIVEEFWGLKAAGASSTVVQADAGRETMRLWLRKLAAVLGAREPAPFGIREVGIQCSEEFLNFVQTACSMRVPGGADSPDMIGHILKHSGDDLEVTSRNLAGLVMTGSAVVTKAFAHAFDQLLRHPQALEAAVVAAKATADDDRAARQWVGRLLIEALRFNPVFPVLPRYCARNTTLARGTPRETEIPAAANVIASPTGAMFDPEAVDDPEHFGVYRNLQFNKDFATDNWDYGSPRDDSPGIYLLFGGGEHWCLGDQMAVAEMAAMGSALLNRLPNPRVVRPLRYDGSAAASLLIGYDE